MSKFKHFEEEVSRLVNSIDAQYQTTNLSELDSESFLRDRALSNQDRTQTNDSTANRSTINPGVGSSLLDDEPIVGSLGSAISNSVNF